MSRQRATLPARRTPTHSQAVTRQRALRRNGLHRTQPRMRARRPTMRRRSRNLVELKNIQALNLPECVLKCGGIISDVGNAAIVARFASRHGAGSRSIYVASVVAAEGEIEHDLMIVEMAVDVAGALEISHGRAEIVGRIRYAGGDAARYRGAAREEPYAYRGRGPFHCVDTAAGAVETFAI